MAALTTSPSANATRSPGRGLDIGRVPGPISAV
jgi:hypothetical protein